MNFTDAQKKVFIGSEVPSWIAEYDWRNYKHPTSSVLHLEKQSHAFEKKRFFRQVHRLETKSAVQNGSVLELDFDPTLQSLHIHSFAVIRGAESIEKLSAARIKLIQRENEAQHYIFTQIWTLVLIIDDVREGDIIEYAYSYAMNSHLTEEIFQDQFYLSVHRPVGQLFFRMIAPPEIQIKYHECGDLTPDSKSMNEASHEWCWTVFNPVVYPWEAGQPSWYDAHARVQFSSFKTWDEVAKWALRIFKSPTELCEPIKQQIAEWQRTYFVAEDLIMAAIRFVQREIRYLSIDERSLGYYSAADPNEVLTRRFGDCKDKTWLLCTLLKAVGIGAYPALVNTALTQTMPSLLPSLRFDHAIVAVEYNNLLYWVDPTHTHQGGTLGTISYPKMKHALIVGKNDRSLVDIEDRSPQAMTKSKLVFDLTAGPEADAPLSIETTYYHECADNIRGYVANLSSEEMTKNYLNYFRGFYPYIQTTSKAHFEDNLHENILTLKESYIISDAALKFQNPSPHYRFELFPFNLIANLINYDIDLSRRTPLSLVYPSFCEEEVIIQFPNNLVLDLNGIELANRYYEYSETWSYHEKKLKVLFSLKTLGDHIDPEDLEMVRTFLIQIKERSQQILWENPRTKQDGLLQRGWKEIKQSTTLGDRIFYSVLIFGYFIFRVWSYFK